MTDSSWKLFTFQLFDTQFRPLVKEVDALRSANPASYKTHPKTKLLAAINGAVKDILSDPLHSKFQLGDTLGEKKKVWRRAKSGLQRYRLFFRFSSEQKAIVLVWFNDEATLRKKGDSHDVYAAFKKMINDGSIPHTFKELIKRSKCY
jgi:toxin YhaV